MIFDADGTIVAWNKACARLTGFSESEMIGSREPWRAFYNAPRPVLADFIAKRATEDDGLFVVKYRATDGGGLVSENWCAMPRVGRALYIIAAASPILDDDGRMIAVVQTVRDATDYKRATEKVEHLVSHDILTGLPNRASMLRHLSDLDAARTPYGLLLVGVDRFQDINDTLGMSAGDAFLSSCGAVLRAVAPDAFLARIGSDEFGLVLPNVIDPDLIAGVAADIVERGEQGVPFDGTLLPVSFSMGASLFPRDGLDASVVARHARLALHDAKAAGGGTHRFFRPALLARSAERRATVVDLRTALAHEQLVLRYQPIARLDGEIVGFEALVRWQHPTRGLIGPNDFIPIAEQSGLIGPIGRWVLRRACADAAKWASPLRISVNLSPIQFRLDDVVETVRCTLDETGLAPDRLDLEITESAMIENPNRTVATLQKLREMGLKIAMDDFGTGHSSLSYLENFPFDKIKLDRSFVARLGKGDRSDAITRMIIGLGRTLDLQIVAEGVETEEQRAFLASEGCDFAQGFLFGRPAAIESFSGLLGLPVAKRCA